MTPFRLSALAATAMGIACAQHIGTPTDDLDKLPLDELFNLPVTSVGRKAQQFSKAPAAVFVLTAEDIRRSGATSVPEALEWVPGLTVLRLDGNSWVVSARGSARMYANKILVMIDGRSLYTPLFSGVIWDALDVSLEDVERIEVVRGPGAVMWGPNAVNGVINIITKSAKATKGGMVTGSAGNELRGAAEARFGAAPSDRLAYRAWGKIDDRSPGYGSPGYFLLENTIPFRDPQVDKMDTASGRLGFRMDGQPDETNQWSLQGDWYKRNRSDPMAYAESGTSQVDRLQGQTDYDGGSIQGRWTHSPSADSESVLQFSYGRDSLEYPFIMTVQNNLTVDFQKRQQTSERNEVYWGVGFQQYWDNTDAYRYTGFSPPDSDFRSGDFVVRDEWQFVPGKLFGSAGVRVDYNSYRHLDYQPSLRLLYAPSATQSAWIAVSRAVREPNRFDRDIRYTPGPLIIYGLPIALYSSGSTVTRAETERSLEAGYRRQSGQRWSVDASVFWSYYQRLVAYEGNTVPTVNFSGAVPQLEFHYTADNPGSGRSYGSELWGMWQVRTGWRLIPSYSYLNEKEWLPPSGTVTYTWGRSPQTLGHQAFLRSQFDLSRTLQFDLSARARSREKTYALPGTLLVDARLGWRPTHSGELSFLVQNVAGRHVLESYPEGPFVALPTRRTFVIKWTQRF